MSKYIKVDDLQKYCDNQKGHSITPNEFQRMTHYNFGWQTGTPTEEGWYLCQLYNDGNWYRHELYKADYFSIIDGKPCWSNYADWNEYPLIAWQKIEPYEENEK